eukprot:2485011-Pyramimonas_sp.AAC.1
MWPPRHGGGSRALVHSPMITAMRQARNVGQPRGRVASGPVRAQMVWHVLSEEEPLDHREVANIAFAPLKGYPTGAASRAS